MLQYGDFECLKAAIQNGADSVYLGATNFNARSRAKNFDLENLKEAIKYAKLRDVKVHLALNILIKNNEFNDALKLAIDCYNAGADAFIIQDLGLLKYLRENYPQIPIHSSTQMTTHNLLGVKQLENLGVERVVLSRELNIQEIENICKNTNCEIETFLHGALCISYSGQCLFSSIIGGRSGNRGLCAGPCRLPYTLLDENGKELNKGYLLSPRDLNGSSSLPQLIKAGVNCFKIEGRLKNPEYVGIVTRYYRKLIDIVYANLDKTNEELNKILLNEENIINPETNMSYLEELKQSFNRGGFSNGHFDIKPNKELIFKNIAGNTGFFLGTVQNFKPNKGYVTFKLEHSIGIGDKISIDSENYTISELMKGNSNIRFAKKGEIITIGRMKGNIKPGQKLFKLQSKILNDNIAPTFKENKEFKKIKLNAIINIKKNEKISFEIFSKNPNSFYYNEKITVFSENITVEAQNQPTTRETIISQISKTGNTPFEFENIELNLDNNLFVPIKSINELRRVALEKLQNNIIEKYITSKNLRFNNINIENSKKAIHASKQISLLLTVLKENINYNKCLTGTNKLYIPLKYFILNNYENQIKQLCDKFNTYIYMPNIIRDNFKINFDEIISKFNIKGFVISSLNQIDLLKKYNLEMIGNYNLNVYNKFTENVLNNYGIKSLCITPELNDFDTNLFIENSNIDLELLVYGNIPLMTMNYCLLGTSNKCYKECLKLCTSSKKFYLKDRLDFKFRILPDNFWNLTKLYNSKITSFDYSNFNVELLRINILDESPEEIKEIISNVKNNIPFKGNMYCGHFNKTEN